MQFKGTKSEENIKAAFAGESQARSRYVFFAEAARAEGNTEIADLFERMAKNELAHARLWFKLLHDGLGDSGANLLESAAGENSEWQSMYPDFAKQARADGCEELAVLFEKVAGIEATHERTFLESYVKLAKEGGIKAPKPVAPTPVPETAEKPAYRCQFCGVTSENPVDVCPVCQAIGAFEKV